MTCASNRPPIRVVITGRASGLPLSGSLGILSRERTTARLRAILDRLS